MFIFLLSANQIPEILISGQPPMSSLAIPPMIAFPGLIEPTDFISLNLLVVCSSTLRGAAPYIHVLQLVFPAFLLFYQSQSVILISGQPPMSSLAIPPMIAFLD